jgi:hypothetical protein
MVVVQCKYLGIVIGGLVLAILSHLALSKIAWQVAMISLSLYLPRYLGM